MRVYLIVQMLDLGLVVNNLVVEQDVARLVLLNALGYFAILVHLQLLDFLLQFLRILAFILHHGLDSRVGVRFQLCLIVDNISPKLDNFLLFMVH